MPNQTQIVSALTVLAVLIAYKYVANNSPALPNI